jgi:hypothetical protein
MTKEVNASDVSALKATLASAIDTWYAALHDEAVVTPPTAVPLKVTAIPGDYTISASWVPNNTKTAAGYHDGRNGNDNTQTDNAGWSTDDPATTTARLFDKLISGTAYVITVTATYTDGTSETATATATPTGTVTPSTSWLATCSSGAYTDHDAAQGSQFATMRNRALKNASMFPTRNGGTAAFENTWWINSAGSVPEIAVAIPMALDGGSLSTDLSSSMTKIANAMKADGRLYYVRLGWEMNLPAWAWKVTNSNLTQWRSRYSQYYDIFKSICGAKALVGFNPNDGANQSGLTGSIMQAWVDGKVDWAGPDNYDWYAGFTSDASVANHLTKDQGMNWWITQCEAKSVPLAVPEWGLSSGTSAGSNGGGDNPRYFTEINRWLQAAKDQGVNVLFESYFNETQSYLLSDLIGNNPNGRARYRSLWTS